MSEPLAIPQWDQIRLACFAGLLALLVVVERLWPRRGDHGPRWRPLHNLALAGVDTALLRLVVPAGAIGAALWAQSAGVGLLPALGIDGWGAFAASLLALDCLIYWQHRIFHRVGPLWRLHRVHHTDPAFDVTTALRFHPLEILLSMGIKIAAVMALGCPPEAVLVFEIALNGCAMFNHADLRLPQWLDRGLRLLIVTPDMHRVHHSIDPSETHRNFGFCLSLWDRLFGSYLPQPRAGHEAMVLGQPDHRSPTDQRLDRLLLQPFESSR